MLPWSSDRGFLAVPEFLTFRRGGSINFSVGWVVWIAI